MSDVVRTYLKPRHLMRPLAMLLCVCALGLGPSQIALVVNRNVPDSLKLAEQYAAARGIPDGRIISLDLPDADEITFDQYEHNVVPPIRDFLRQHFLRPQVRCLVTFYGVPFRIRDRVDTPDEKQELADLRTQLSAVLDQSRTSVEKLEQLTRQLSPAYQPPPRVLDESDANYLAQRYSAALRSAGARLAALKALATTPTTSPAGGSALRADLLALMTTLGGPADLLDHARVNNGDVAEQQKWTALQNHVMLASAQVLNQEQLRYDATARANVRRITAEAFGVIRLGQILESQIDYLTPGTSNAALDSELALLWFNYYPRAGPWINPMNFFNGNANAAMMTMVSRLDGPDAATVSRMIDTSVRVEHQGLHGLMAVNSFGYPSNIAGDGRNHYVEFDHTLRGLGEFVEEHANIPVQQEYTRLFANHEVGPTALYCGWYSLRRYVPGMKFSPGAVGYHVASLEMVALHQSYEAGWVHGLLSDGVVATLGPVAEPYLVAFPPPEQFFPLLMTGKLTLAEIYWKTQQTSSWMMCLIGDPLYTPYKVDPALRPEDLPPALRAVLGRIAPTTNSSPPRQ
jgi:uncharacterized protein (TIGR03790 family)